jgi:hypothetical protein
MTRVKRKAEIKPALSCSLSLNTISKAEDKSALKIYRSVDQDVA